MEHTLGLLVLAVLAVAAAAVASRRVGIASPLILVALGAVVGLLPFVPAIEVEPEWILLGVLPPLLYSAAVSMPAMEFRREFAAISGMSVLLVVLSAVVLGWFFTLVIPDLSFAWGVALGAIMSPTDAVATSIVKRVGVSPRIVAILEGEGLLNDATALVLLRAATAAAATGWSVGGVVRDFVVAAALASAIGYAVGRANLWLRARTPEASVNTAISLTVPFVAALPAEHLGASGLVAAVVAGLVTGRHAPRVLSPQHRLSDKAVWRTAELLLEGAVFLVMGLELYGLLVELDESHHSLPRTAVVAATALVLVLVVRAAYVAPVLMLIRRRARRGVAIRDHVDSMRQLTEDPEKFAAALKQRVVKTRGGTRLRRIGRAAAQRRSLRFEPEHVERFGARLRRKLADIDYLVGDPLGPREGAVVVWAGMRGAVTLAAAQTLPADTPDRSLLVFLGFLVAAGSLLVQGSTLRLVVRLLRPAGVDTAALAAERTQLGEVLAATADRVRADGPTDPLTIIAAQRDVLLDLSREGSYATTTLRDAMALLDSKQISVELRVVDDD